MGRVLDDEGIVCRVVGLPGEYPERNVSRSRSLCLRLSKEHPERWVVAHWPDGRICHRLEPTSCADDDPESLLDLLPDQEALF